MLPKDADGMANSVDPDQTSSDLGLHCLPRPAHLKVLITNHLVSHSCICMGLNPTQTACKKKKNVLLADDQVVSARDLWLLPHPLDWLC